MADRNPELLKKATINIRNPGEVELWTEALNIWTADLVRAVDEVGNSAEAVLAYLRERGVNTRALDSQK
jgi:hypothetical protein